MWRIVFVVLFVVVLQNSLLFAHSTQVNAQPNQEALNFITVENYCSFLQAMGASDLHGLYESGAQVVRLGEVGNYYYEVIVEEENEPMAFLSTNDVLAYCAWKNSQLPSSISYLPPSCDLGAASIDPLLKSNQVTLPLLGPSLGTVGAVAAATDTDWSTDILYGILGVAVFGVFSESVSAFYGEDNRVGVEENLHEQEVQGNILDRPGSLIASEVSAGPRLLREENDENSSSSEDELADFWTQRHFAILGRQIRKKSPAAWNEMLFDLMKESTPFEGTEPLTEEAFDQEINEVIAETEENLFYLKEAREWLIKKIHYAIRKELPLIIEMNPTRELETGLTLSPWQPTVHYPYQQLRIVDFKAESNALYWDQQRALYSQFAEEATDPKRRKKFEEACTACAQAEREAQVTKKALEQLVLDIGSTEEISNYTSRRWERFVNHPLESVEDFFGFQCVLEGIERLSEDENVSYPHSPGFKFILPAAKNYFKEKWKGFSTAREQLIRSVVSSSSQDADNYVQQAISQCETFYNQFKKTPILGSQIGKLLIEPLKKELLADPKKRAMEEQKKIKDAAYDADENNAIWMQEETPEESLKEQMVPQWQPVREKALQFIEYLGELKTQNVQQLWMQKVLEAAGKKTGNFNLLAFYLAKNERAVSKTVADELGKLWVDENSIETSSSGISFNQLVSSDGLRRYRSPTSKYKGPNSHAETGIQANFEWRTNKNDGASWLGNGHLDISLPSSFKKKR